MAAVYILYSQSADKYYTGSTKNTIQRLQYHQRKEFPKSFTAKYQDWELYFSIDNLSINCAKRIELHIKAMKSRIYITNLRKYPEMAEKLIAKYSS